MISSRQQFTLLADNTLEVVLRSEQKLKYDSLSSRLMKNPDCRLLKRSQSRGAREIDERRRTEGVR